MLLLKIGHSLLQPLLLNPCHRRGAIYTSLCDTCECMPARNDHPTFYYRLVWSYFRPFTYHTGSFKLEIQDDENGDLPNATMNRKVLVSSLHVGLP